jgi:chaperonin cofactor prefoldin
METAASTKVPADSSRKIVRNRLGLIMDRPPATQARSARTVAGLVVAAAATVCAVHVHPVGAASTNANISTKATEGMVTRADVEIVDCSLPGQVRQLGNMTYIGPRRPTHTTAADCRHRGGEYVAYDRANLGSALKVWMASAETGDAEAQTNVGEIYERGIGNAPPNYEAALIWYQKAADQGYSRALFNLGTLYEQGLGVEPDKLKAMNYYRQAWGIPESNFIYADAAKREQDAVRAELEKKIAEQEGQIGVLETQVEQLRTQLKHSASNPGATTELQKQIDGLNKIIETFKGDSRQSQAKLAAVAVTREPLAVSAPPALDPKAFARQVRGLNFGRFYAVVIGNQDYQILENLQTPKTDAERMAVVLRDRYGFNVQIIEDANDVTMLRALNDLNKVLKPDDNVLIYYAGHGTRLQTAQREVGYWLPVNAERPPDDTFWVPNEQISAHLGRLVARRVLVVADSCYAALLSNDPDVNIFGTENQLSLEYLKYKLPKRSRLLMASGGDQPVLDSGGQGNSIFARAFLDVLQSNEGILSTAALFSQVRERVKAAAVRNNFHQVPEFKSIKGAGHEVGDFFFVPNVRG